MNRHDFPCIIIIMRAGLAAKRISFLKVPKVLIIRFKRSFIGNTKLHKHVYFPLEFVLDHDWLVSAEGLKYEVFAMISHHGVDSSHGHYTTAARYPDGKWLRFDDTAVTAINTEQMMNMVGMLRYGIGMNLWEEPTRLHYGIGMNLWEEPTRFS